VRRLARTREHRDDRARRRRKLSRRYDYIADESISKFEQATGIDVTYDVIDTNAVLETKLMAGHTGYDLGIPSTSFMTRQVGAGVYRAIDHAKLTLSLHDVPGLFVARPQSEAKVDLDRVEATLRSIRPYVRKISSITTINHIASREVCVSAVNAGDMALAQLRAREIGMPFHHAVVVPREGSLIWV